jgi:hypothetical protein
VPEAVFHHEHNLEPVSGGAPARTFRLPAIDREWRDVIVVVAGCVFMALCGAGLATYLALPFGQS